MSRVIVFLDYWNFQLGWNRRAVDRHGRALQCDFLRLPAEAVALADGSFGATPPDPLQLIATRVYASHDPANPKDRTNRDWMAHLMGAHPGFHVQNARRRARPDPIRCRDCGHEQHHCERCQALLTRAAEKTVDASLIVDLLTLAWDDAYDIALLISSDRDFLPPILALRERGVMVVNARWSDQGTRLADACDASFRLDPLIPRLARSNNLR